MKFVTVSVVSPSICHEVMGLDAMIIVFWMLSVKPTFSLSSFTFIKRLFSSSSYSAISMGLSTYPRLLIFHPAILIPACASSSPAFLMMLSSVAQSCLTLCNPVDYSTPGSLSITNSWNLLKLMSIESVMPSNHLIFCCPFSSCLQSFPVSGSFLMSQFFTSGGQSIGVSASASVLPKNIQDWFPLGWTGWISWQSKGLSRQYTSQTSQFKSINSLAFSFLYSPTLTSIHDCLKNHSFD